MTYSLTREQWLLNASGLIAIGLVTWLGLATSAPWQATVVHALFAVIFSAAAFDDALKLPPRVVRLLMPVLLVLLLIALYLYPDTITLVLAVVLAASAPYHLSVRESWLLMVAGNLAFWLVLAARQDTGEFVFGFLTLAALQGFAISSSLARRRDAESRAALSRQNNELLAARAVLAQRSQTEERLRIAGELHDTIGHRLTALQLHLEALSHQVSGDVREQVLGCRTMAVDLLENVRAIVRDMSGRRARSLLEAVRELEGLTPGVTIAVTGPLPAIDEHLERELVFCFQEGIHNAVRHGGATRIEIHYENDSFLLTDNGRGLRGRPARWGFGLRNINKRLRECGGMASLAARDGAAGCTLRLCVGATPSP